MRSRNPSITLTLLLLLLALAACGPSGEPTTTPIAPGETAAIPTLPPADAPTDQAGYPAPSPATPEAYPAEGQGALPPTVASESYPPPQETFLEPRFRFDQPVSATATTVTGQAPPGLALAILDVTYNGAVLGTGRSDDAGRFSIPVSGLVEGNRIGIAIGELAAGQTLSQMLEQYFPYRGEGFMNLPNVGVFLDTVQVQP